MLRLESVVYAIIEDSGTQFLVRQGDTVDIDLRPLAQDQTTIEFDRVLLLKDDQQTIVGTPIVAGAKVIAQISDTVKGPKLRMVKHRRRKNSITRTGHRQKFLKVTIADIHSPA